MAIRTTISALLLTAAACGSKGSNTGDAAGATGEARVQTADLTGYYETQDGGDRRAWMCMVAKGPGLASFGLVSRNSQGPACSGAGEAMRQGDVLRLTMAGDEECLVEAKMTDRRVAFSARVPEGCAYYCGPGATLGGQTFVKTGGAVEDAREALDLAGGPLCG